MADMTEAENRAATHARLAQCAAARKAATEAALAAGDDADAASEKGHAAATAIWNAWADALLAKRTALEAAGAWKTTRTPFGGDVPATPETRAWFAEAQAIVSTAVAPHVFAEDFDARGWRFPGTGRFDKATFEGNAGFNNATFKGNAGFGAIKADRAFSLAFASFAETPDFIQAKFSEPPRLDNARFRPGVVEPGRFWSTLPERGRALVKRLFDGDASGPAQQRALRRLAEQGKDTERELEFFAAEVRASRFVDDPILPFARPNPLPRLRAVPLDVWQRWFGRKTDRSKPARPRKRLLRARARWGRAERWTVLFFRNRFPFPVVPWRGAAWSGFVRFWLGLVYGFFSDYGRSLFRPLVLLAAVTCLATLAYLGQTPAALAVRAGSFEQPLGAWARTYLETAKAHYDADAPCFMGDDTRDALPDVIRTETTAKQEAFQMAVRNAVVVLEGSAEVTTRALGCLYGFSKTEKTAGGEASVRQLILPPEVSTIIGLQKFFSAIALFLIGLAIRNMLRMK